MRLKDYLILIATILVSVAISFYAAYWYFNKEAEKMEQARDAEKKYLADYMRVIDSLRVAGNATVAKVEKRYYESKKPIPLVMDEASLLISARANLIK